MGGNYKHWTILRRYLVALALALSVVLTIPANADVQKPVSTTVQVVKVRQAPPEPVIPPAIMAKWEKVAQCEQGGNWHVRGPIYSGGLGITEVNWMAYGGWIYGAEYAATPAEQVAIAIKIQALNGYAGYVPHQNGCEHGW
jgi:hypothetical protein